MRGCSVRADRPRRCGAGGQRRVRVRPVSRRAGVAPAGAVSAVDAAGIDGGAPLPSQRQATVARGLCRRLARPEPFERVLPDVLRPADGPVDALVRGDRRALEAAGRFDGRERHGPHRRAPAAAPVSGRPRALWLPPHNGRDGRVQRRHLVRSRLGQQPGVLGLAERVSSRGRAVVPRRDGGADRRRRAAPRTGTSHSGALAAPGASGHGVRLADCPCRLRLVRRCRPLAGVIARLPHYRARPQAAAPRGGDIGPRACT